MSVQCTKQIRLRSFPQKHYFHSLHLMFPPSSFHLPSLHFPLIKGAVYKFV
uniref:Uncharacterized protein n=1 Tax=Anguilla anguilla TaxID=7936 RepID=A0A0E9SF31_ANGAN